MQRTDIRTFNISENSYGTTLEDIWQGEVPSHLIIGMVKSEAYSGAFDLNPFRFEHCSFCRFLCKWRTYS